MVGPLSLMVPEGFEQVAYGHDAATGLRAIVAIHSTVLGPGPRRHPLLALRRPRRRRLVDVCRLAKGMTYKHAAAGLDQGGGKAVILGDPATMRTEALILAYGRFVDGLAGRYLTAEDVGTTQADMDLIRTVTPHVTGVSERLGGSGDPSPATALGRAVRHAGRGRAALGRGRPRGSPRVHQRRRARSGRPSPTTCTRRGAASRSPTSAPPRSRRWPAAPVRRWWLPSERTRSPCDIFSPCALGAVLSAATIPELRCAAVVGSANNQLATRAGCPAHRTTPVCCTRPTTWSTPAE